MNPLTVCFWQSPLLGGPLKRIEEPKQGAIINSIFDKHWGVFALPKSHLQLHDPTPLAHRKKWEQEGVNRLRRFAPEAQIPQVQQSLISSKSVVLGTQSPSTVSVDPGGRQFSSFRFDLLSNRTCLSMDPGKFGFVGTSSWANSPRFKDTYNVRLVGAGFKAWISSSSWNDPVAARFICNQSKAMRKQFVVAWSKEAFSLLKL